jgi:hypothetical protein
MPTTPSQLQMSRLTLLTELELVMIVVWTAQAKSSSYFEIYHVDCAAHSGEMAAVFPYSEQFYFHEDNTTHLIRE